MSLKKKSQPVILKERSPIDTLILRQAALVMPLPGSMTPQATLTLTETSRVTIDIV